MSGMGALARLGGIAPDVEGDREAMAPVEPLIAADLLGLYDGQPMAHVPIPDPLPVITRRALVTVAVIAVAVGLLIGGTVAFTAAMVIGATLGNPTPGIIMGALLGLPVALAATAIPGARIALTTLPQRTQHAMAHAIEANALRETLLVREQVRAGVRDGDLSLDTAMDTLTHAAPDTDLRHREH